MGDWQLRNETMIALITVLFIVTVLPPYTQSTPIAYGHSIGGAYPDGLDAMAVDADGAVYLAGGIGSENGFHAEIAKFSPEGTLIWQKMFPSDPYFDSIVVTPYGDIYVAGGGTLMKLSPDAVLQWARKFADIGSLRLGFDPAINGTIVTGGWGVVAAVDADGTLLWSVCPDYPDYYYTYTPVSVTIDGSGDIFVLYDPMGLGSVIGIAKLDSTGRLLGQKHFDVPNAVWAYDLTTTSTGDIIWCGSYVENDTMLIGSLNNHLKSLWVEDIQVPGYYTDGYRITSANDGTAYVFTPGYSWVNGSSCDMIMHIGASGALMGTTAIDQTGESTCSIQDIEWTSDGVMLGGSIQGLPPSEVSERSDPILRPLAYSWVDNRSTWSDLDLGIAAATLTAPDSDLPVDNFDWNLGMQLWYGAMDVPTVVAVTIHLNEPLKAFLENNMSASSWGGTGPYTYEWFFGDGSTASGQNVSHIYTAGGAFFVQVYSSDSGGRRGYNSTRIMVSGPPVVTSTSHEPHYWWVTEAQGQLILFGVAAFDPDGGNLTYSWDFGDGNVTGPQSNFSVEHRFAEAGNHTVYALVSDDDGYSTVATINLTIAVNQRPSLHVWYSPDSPHTNNTIQFYCDVYDPDDLFMHNIIWDFGDNTSVEAQNPAHSYSVQGDYLATVTAIDYGGFSSSVSINLSVRDNWLPLADLGAPTAIFANRTATFIDYSFDPDGYIVSWSLDFGDGTVASGGGYVPWHTYTYSKGGDYNVTLRLCDNEGANASITLPVHVVYAIEASFDTSPAYPLQFEPATFNASSSHWPDGPIQGFYWDFGDGHTCFTTVPWVSHTYSAPGNYHVSMEAWANVSDGFTASFCNRTVRVDPPLVVNAGLEQTVDEGTTVVLNGSASGGGGEINYTWSLVYDGLPMELYGPSPSFDFAIPGNYSVNLTVTDGHGHGITDKVMVNVIPLAVPVPEISPGPSLALTVMAILAVFCAMRGYLGRGPARRGRDTDK